MGQTGGGVEAESIHGTEEEQVKVKLVKLVLDGKLELGG
jgi:hypothetical protein